MGWIEWKGPTSQAPHAEPRAKIVDQKTEKMAHSSWESTIITMLMYLCVGTVLAILYSDIIIIPEVQDFIVKILGGQAGVEWERRVQHQANDANMEAALAKNRA